MKRLDAKGFGVIEGLLILVILGIIGGAGFYVYKANKKTSNVNEGITIAKQEQREDFKYSGADIPVDWKTYKNDAYGFSFQYPNNLKIEETTFTNDELDNSADKAIFVVQAVFPNSHGGYEVRVLKDTLNRSVENDGLLTNDNLYKNTIKKENIYKSGLKAVMLSYEPENAKISYFYFEGINGLVYRFGAVEESGSNEKTSKAIYNSLAID